MNIKKSKIRSDRELNAFKLCADGMIETLAKHPLLSALAVCLIINPFHLGSIGNIPMNALYIELIAVISAMFFIIRKAVREEYLKKREGAALFCAVSVLCFILACFYQNSQAKAIWILLFGFGAVFLIFLITETKYCEQMNCLLIISLSFVMKLYYILCTSVYERQHDVLSFNKDNGHAGYIMYLVNNHRLPDFDVRSVWQFHHPPLHHAISAVWIKLNRLIGVGVNQSIESLQTLTLFYAIAIVIVSYKILKALKLKSTALYVSLAVIAFHPTFTFFAGSINNDVLATLFMMGAILCTVNWYNNQKTSEILKIAVCMGLGMMSKFSAALAAPPIALVFLTVFFKNRKNAGEYIKQFACFALVCVPLGMWFYIKNLVSYGVPISYVAKIPETNWLYIGNQSFISRITDFSPALFKNVFEAFSNQDWLPGGAYNEYNPLIALFKTSLFSEFINRASFENMPSMITVSTIFFYVSACLAAAGFVFMIIVLSRRGMAPIHKILFGSFYALMILSFYKTAYDYPFTCTINFRYISPVAVVSALFIGMFLQLPGGREDRLKKVISYSVISATVIFCILSVAVYTAAVFIEG